MNSYVSINKTYAIKWDGSNNVLNEINHILETQLDGGRAWIVNDSKALRLDYDLWQGQDWCDLGNYLIFDPEYKFAIMDKDKFEKIYVIENDN